MQDIQRNKLLDKLAAGWKVRRKGWQQGIFSPNFFHQDDLIANDWEGKPPESVCVYRELTVYSAFRYLCEDKCNLHFIRRKSWPCTKFLKDNGSAELLVSDIVAEDWEVWG